MKVATIIAVCLGIAVRQHSNAQSTNEPKGASSRAHLEAKEVKNIGLNIDYGLGHVLMSEQRTSYLVQLPIGGGSSFKKYTPPDANSLSLQVWLLRPDGSVIPQRERPSRIMIGNAGVDNHYMIYIFDKGSSNNLAGIAVRAKGKLYCQEIGADKK